MSHEQNAGHQASSQNEHSQEETSHHQHGAHQHGAHQHGEAGHHGHGGAAGDADWGSMSDLLDLDATVLDSLLADVIAWIRDSAVDEPRRILDLGAGTGTGTVALARRFDAATLIALDGSEVLLDAAQEKAHTAGYADRVETVLADFDKPWPAIDPVDLVWASLTMHHMADPGRALRDAIAVTRGGGLLAVLEMETPPTFLPSDIGSGEPGLETRVQDALRGVQARAMPHLGADWGPQLLAAGYATVDKRVFTTELRPPHSTPVNRYAQTYFSRVRSAVADLISHSDRAALDRLLDSSSAESFAQRTDLVVRGERTVWLARRS